MGIRRHLLAAAIGLMVVSTAGCSRDSGARTQRPGSGEQVATHVTPAFRSLSKR